MAVQQLGYKAVEAEQSKFALLEVDYVGVLEKGELEKVGRVWVKKCGLLFMFEKVELM